jgi:predicted aconitase with swiveling domain
LKEEGGDLLVVVESLSHLGELDLKTAFVVDSGQRLG